jgi:ferric iron reductase protein FhuF
MTSDTPVRLTGRVELSLITAALYGPFFHWEPWSPSAGWRPWTSLADGDVAGEQVAAAREKLIAMFGLPSDEVPLRVVASVTFLGYASRVVSPLLGAAGFGTLPATEPDQLWWRAQTGGPLPLAYGKTRPRPCTRMDPAELAEALAEVAVGGLLTPLLETFQRRFTLSPKVLWGNVASALGGAAGVMADHAAKVAEEIGRPGYEPPRIGSKPVDRVGWAAKLGDQAERAASVVEAMLRIGPLAGTGTLVRPVEDRARHFLIRHNCCLYYRIPGGGTCGDCVLTPQDERRRGWESVLAR